MDVVEEKERQILILKRALKLLAETLVAIDTAPKPSTDAWIRRYIDLAEEEAKRSLDLRYPYDTEKYVELGI